MKAKETNTYVELITATQNRSDGSDLFDLFYMKINLNHNGAQAHQNK
jgi:hypothetical protein